MLPEVFRVLHDRFVEQGEPPEGWVFPSSAAGGHFEGSTAKGYHARAIKKANENLAEDVPALKKFEPYVMRHTALTRLGESGCDVFTLARIAGHSSIVITQRYVHPQADAIERAFSNLSGHKTRHTEQIIQLLPAPKASKRALFRKR